jgi:FkbM family methyltransferase
MSRSWTVGDGVDDWREPVRETLRRMRPAKVRVALKRRWFELLMERTPTCTAPGLADLGSAPGGWTVPTGLIEPSWLCYSVGAGADISFDLELIRRCGVTVRAIEAVPGYVELARERAGAEPRFTIRQAALATWDGPVRMQLTHERVSAAVSSAGLYESDDYVVLPGRSLRSLMDEQGDTTVQLLKLDIEGAEYGVVPALDLHSLGVQLLCCQLHHVAPVRRARRLARLVREQGFEIVACRPAVKLTFARRELLAGGARRRGVSVRRRGSRPTLGARRTARRARGPAPKTLRR